LNWACPSVFFHYVIVYGFPRFIAWTLSSVAGQLIGFLKRKSGPATQCP
jgi:hypothetical protein